MIQRLLSLWALSIVAVLLVAIEGSKPTDAQVPTATPPASLGPTFAIPTPPPLVPTPGGSSICAAPQFRGGQTITILTLAITLPPEGDYVANFGIAEPGGEFVRVCYVQGNSAIFFNTDGTERSRVVTLASANAVLEQIARSVRVIGATTVASPSPATTSVAPIPSMLGGSVRPPSTGDGGLAE